MGAWLHAFEVAANLPSSWIPTMYSWIVWCSADQCAGQDERLFGHLATPNRNNIPFGATPKAHLPRAIVSPRVKENSDSGWYFRQLWLSGLDKSHKFDWPLCNVLIIHVSTIEAPSTSSVPTRPDAPSTSSNIVTSWGNRPAPVAAPPKKGPSARPRRYFVSRTLG